MAFEQFTKCVEPADFVPRTIALIVMRALILAPFAAILVLGSGHPICWVFVGEIVGMSAVIAYCRNWLYERLICLGGDRYAVGAIVRIEPAETALFDFDWDNDYSINLLLQNTEMGVSQEDAENSEPFGYLIKNQNVISDPPVNRETPGITATDVNDADHPGGTGTESAVLHAEFEGSGNLDLLQVAEAGLAFSVAALIACLALPFPANLIVSIALGFLALFALIAGAIIGNYNRPGSPSDVNPSLGTLHTNSDPNGGKGSGADIVYVEGTWVYDSLHDGWNEIHPIKCCTLMGRWTGTWETPQGVILRLRQQFELARAAETQANQARPEHQWQIHPEIDACEPVVIL